MLKEIDFAKIVKVRAGSFSAALSQDQQLYIWGKGTFGNFYRPHRVKFFQTQIIEDF